MTPPDYVLAGAKAELARGEGASCCSSGGGCGHAQRGAKAGKLAQVKQRHAAPSNRGAAAAATSPPRNAAAFIPLALHQKCRGLAAVWWMLGEAVAPEFAALVVAAPLAGERLVLISDAFSSRGDAPEPPPPRTL